LQTLQKKFFRAPRGLHIRKKKFPAPRAKHSNFFPRSAQTAYALKIFPALRAENIDFFRAPRGPTLSHMPEVDFHTPCGLIHTQDLCFYQR
jgi:hypothetical protein